VMAVPARAFAINLDAQALFASVLFLARIAALRTGAGMVAQLRVRQADIVRDEGAADIHILPPCASHKVFAVNTAPSQEIRSGNRNDVRRSLSALLSSLRLETPRISGADITRQTQSTSVWSRPN